MRRRRLGRRSLLRTTGRVLLAFDCSFDCFVSNLAVAETRFNSISSCLGVGGFELGVRAERGDGWIGCDAYQGACDVDAAIAHARVIQPLWLGEAEESVV